MPILATLDPRTLFDASPNACVLLDTELRIVAANRAYLRVTMRECVELLGQPMFDAFPSAPDSPSGRQLRQSFARVLASGAADHVASIRYPIAKPNGSLDDCHWSARIAPDVRTDARTDGRDARSRPRAGDCKPVAASAAGRPAAARLAAAPGAA